MICSVCVILAGCLWGLLSIFVTVLTDAGFTTMQCVALRSVFTAIVLFFYLLIADRRKLKIRLRHLPCFLGMGILSVVFFNFCYFRCITLMGGACIPALLLYTAPAFVIILSAIFFHEKITLRKVAAMILTFVGLIIVTGALTGGETVSLPAVLYGLGAGLGYALYSIFGKFVVDYYEPITITFYTFVVAAVTSVPISGVWENSAALLQPQIIAALAGLVLFVTVAPYLFYTKGLSGIEAGKASILATIEPVAAAAVGILYFREEFPPSKIIGMLLVLAAIIYLNTGEKKN